MENFTNQNYHGNYKKKQTNNRNRYTPPKYVLQGGRSSGTSAGDSVDELPNEPTVDSTQSSPGGRTDWDKATVYPYHRSNSVSSNGLSRHTQVPDEHQTNLSRSSRFNV